MAKTESTAVNELIDLVQSGKPPAGEPSDDLFGASSGSMHPPRMTSTVPPMRGAGEVAPLPARRAPHATSQHAQLPPPVRMSTAPEHGDTIPPIGNVRTTAASPAVPRPRATSPSMPPIPRSTQSQAAISPPPVPRKTQSQAAISPPPVPRSTQSQSAISPPPVPRATQSQAAISPPPIPRASSPSNVTHSSPTLPSPRTTVPSFPPAKPSIPTVEMPRASKPSLPPPRQTPRATQPPMMMPVVAPFEPTPEPAKLPAATIARLQEELLDDAVTITTDTDSWYQPSVAVAKQDATVMVATRSTASLIRKLIPPAIIVGIGIGAFIATRAETSKKDGAPPPAAAVAEVQPAVAEQPVEQAARPPVVTAENSGTASALGEQPQPPTKEEGTPPPEVAAEAASELAPAPAPAPSAAAAEPAVAAPAVDAAPVREVQTTKGVVKLVDVRIDSKPAGATVMLVDNGKTSFLGTTPVATSLDASRAYDVVFTLEGRPTQMAHLDPAKDTRLAVSLHRSSSKSKKVSKAESSFDLGSVVEKPASETKAAKEQPAKETKVAKTDDVDHDETAKATKPEKAVAKTGAGEGTLMVSSKPPCEIYIDGKATGLTTPQRSIHLSAGSHKVTFVNASAKITKTVPVTISADQPTKLIQDLMKK